MIFSATTAHPSPTTETLSRCDLADLTERVGDLFASPHYSPPMLPGVAVELLDVAMYPELNLRRIAAMIAQDPLLAGRVMQRVRSPLYRGWVPVGDLQHAILRLGLNHIRDIVIEAALDLRVFQTTGYADAMERVRQHSVATAHIAKILAPHTGQDPHEMFLLGLLHDVGIAAALITVDQIFDGKRRPPIEQIWPVLEAIHESTGTLVTRIWDLPSFISTHIGSHHHAKAGASHPAVSTLCIAEAIAGRLDRGITPRDRPEFFASAIDLTPPDVVASARTALNLEREVIVSVLRSAEERLDAVA